MAKPKRMVVDYEDGLRAFLLELNRAVGEWSAAWRYSKDRRIESTQFSTQEARPGAHSGTSPSWRWNEPPPPPPGRPWSEQ